MTEANASDMIALGEGDGRFLADRCSLQLVELLTGGRSLDEAAIDALANAAAGDVAAACCRFRGVGLAEILIELYCGTVSLALDARITELRVGVGSTSGRA